MPAGVRALNRANEIRSTLRLHEPFWEAISNCLRHDQLQITSFLTPGQVQEATDRHLRRPRTRSYLRAH